MRSVAMCLAAVCLIVFLVGPVAAQDKGPVATVIDGCKAEIEGFCKNVSPGEGRILACLYAYEDKLSNRCEYALYDAAAQLQRIIAALSYAVNECRDDLKAYCANIKPGEGRLLQCLDRNTTKVSGRCKQALKDTGLK